MTHTSKTRRERPHRPGRTRPGFDRLETRLALSGPGASLDLGLIGGGLPASFPSAIVATPPTTTTPAALRQARDLGPVGGDATETSGSLDLADNPLDVRFYRVEVPAGQTWRLGVSVGADRIGSPLSLSVSLFDASGNILGTSPLVQQGEPSNPYLFAKVEPGTYYIGVSGGGNVAGTPTGYDPALADPGSSTSQSPSGPFSLSVVADPATQATHLIALKPTYADPESSTPTGLSLQFDDGLDLRSALDSSTLPIRVIDSTGTASSIVPIGYDASTATLNVVFRGKPSPGSYTVVTPGQGGLVDLLGRTPISIGLPAGVLGSFTVSPETTSPSDIGAVYPDDAVHGVRGIVNLGVGESSSSQFTILTPGLYNLKTTVTGSSADFEVIGSGKDVSFSTRSLGVAESHRVLLTPGAYTLKSTGSDGITRIDWDFHLEEARTSNLRDLGVGQSDGLSLRLLNSNATVSDTSAASAPIAAPSSGTTAAVSPGSPAASLGFAAGPVGHPTTESNAITVVGPTTPSGLSALATSSPGIPAGLSYGYGQKAPARLSTTVGAIEETLADGGDAEVSGVEATANQGEVVATTTELPPLPTGPESSRASAGGLGLALERVAATFASLIPTPNASRGTTSTVALDDAAIENLVADSGEEADQAESTRPSGVAVTVGVTIFTAAMVASSRRIGQWFVQRRVRLVQTSDPAAPFGIRRRI